jgi:hypothetical protein
MLVLKYTREACTFLSLLERKKNWREGAIFLKKLIHLTFLFKKTQVEGERGKIALEARIQKH